MQFEEGGSRIDDLKLILSRVAYAASLFDDDGIQVRFMNSDRWADNLKTEDQVQALIRSVTFQSVTPLGTQMRAKVIDGIILPKLREGSFRKPVLVITITDGQPTGESQEEIFKTIRYASAELSRSPYGPGAISFQFAQVGNDEKAKEFLARLDSDEGIGKLVDCTSSKRTLGRMLRS